MIYALKSPVSQTMVGQGVLSSTASRVGTTRCFGGLVMKHAPVRTTVSTFAPLLSDQKKNRRVSVIVFKRIHTGRTGTAVRKTYQVSTI